MRRIRYAVACSLDGYIAGPKGEADWVLMDPEIDFTALYAQFSTALMGRHTYEWMLRYGQEWMPQMEIFVFSGTLRQQDHPQVIIGADPVETAAALREKPGKDIWIFGGGQLFRTLLDAGLVHTVEVAVIPVLLGDGIPLLPSPAKTAKLSLKAHKVYASGIVSLEYMVASA